MKAHFRTQDNRITFEVEGIDQKAVFKQIALVQEVFDAESECGCCQSKAIRLRVRMADDNEYYEIVCEECHARFQFGQAKKGGTLFPKRRDESGALPNRGWARWEGKKGRAA